MGCASAPKPPPLEPVVAITEPVPLVAPDEAQGQPVSKRLTGVKTLGEGTDGYARPARNGAAPAQTVVYANAAYPRGYYGARSMRVVMAPGTPGSSVGTTPGTPAVGGNWHAPPSYGPPALR
ncbi:MAG TPA: hypothetical protein VIF62_23180 [Labilithrix sp.]